MPDRLPPRLARGRRRSGYLRWALLLPLAVAALAGWPPSRAQAAADAARYSAAQLQLDHGRRWPADAALRMGMRRIRAIALWMQQAQADGPLSARQAHAVTTAIEDSVAAIVEQPPRGTGADANLHRLLARILAADRLPQLLDALSLYPRYFDDPDWAPAAPDAPPAQRRPDDAGAPAPTAQP